jgi:hypothetical protein
MASPAFEPEALVAERVATVAAPPRKSKLSLIADTFSRPLEGFGYHALRKGLPDPVDEA